MRKHQLRTKKHKLRKKKSRNVLRYASCGEKYLFQQPITTEQINNWTPLLCSVSDPRNCGPTALKFLFPEMGEEKIQFLSFKTEKRGATLEEFSQFMYDQTKHLDLYTHVNSLVSLDILDFFRKTLNAGNITVIGLENNTRYPPIKHITTIAKDFKNDIYLFDGQTNTGYMNEQIIQYINSVNYNIMYIWCSKHKRKRKRSSPTPKGKYTMKKRRIGSLDASL